MSITVMPNSKWQPSVLHLLPFSSNDAGASTSASSPSLTSSGAPMTASYIPNESRGFPALAISQNDGDKLRSKSAGAPVKIIGPRKQQSAKILSNNTRERLAPRAKSEYGLNVNRKAEVVRFSINDINEQILGRSRTFGGEGSSNSESPELPGIGKEEPSDGFKTKHLPKPVVRSRDGKRINARFWRSSCISPGELELQKHKAFLENIQNRTRKSKRVKLNVKDLPRSKTPIGENDPDKLNMKQVIAFLQNNTEEKDIKENQDVLETKPHNEKSLRVYNENSGKINKEIPSHNVTQYGSSNPESKALSNNFVKKSLPNDDNIEKDESTTVMALTESATHTESAPWDPSSSQRANLICNSSTERYENDFIRRPGSYHADKTTNPPAYHDSYYIRNRNEGMRPKSLNALYEKTDFRLPANLRHIRETARDNGKPFRLHRFLTLVSNTPDSSNVRPLITTTKSNIVRNSRQSDDIIASRDNHNNTQSSSRSHLPLRSSSQGSRTDTGRKTDSKVRFDVEARLHSDARDPRRYHLSSESNGDISYSSHPSRSLQSEYESEYQKESQMFNRKNKNKVICLPTAPVDIDSDEDYNPRPTVPTRLDRKDVVLSAKGHAIIARDLPQFSKLHQVKNGLRPHSVKDFTKPEDYKIDYLKTNNSSLRPHSLKANNTIRDDQEGGLSYSSGAAFEDNQHTKPVIPDWGLNSSSEAVNGDVRSVEDDKNSGSASDANKPLNNKKSSSSPSSSLTSPNRSDGKSNHSSNNSKHVGFFPTEVLPNGEDGGGDDDNNNNNNNTLDDNAVNIYLGRDNVERNVINEIHSVSDINAMIPYGSRNSSKIRNDVSSSGDPVKLTLRKERNLTRELTYMGDMESPHSLNSSHRSSRKHSNGFSARDGCQ